MTYLFDMDGVLVNSEPVILKAAIAALKEYHITAHPDDFKPFVGAGEDRFVGGVAEKYGAFYQTSMKKRTYEIYAKLAPSFLEIYPNTKKTLQALKQKGHTLALASSADYEKVQVNLKVANIDEHLFDGIITGSDVKAKKPAPDCYIKAAALCKSEPENCLVVEDAINGIQAAKAAGMRVAALTTSFSKEILLPYQPDYIFDDISELL